VVLQVAAGDVSPRRARRERLKAEVRRLLEAHKGKRGSPMIAADLHDLGWRVSKNTVAALMAEMGLAARPKARRRGGTRPGKGRQDARTHRTWGLRRGRHQPQVVRRRR
jgi:putative transposase